MKKISIEAPGKVILSGEHSAVYGYPAIVASIDRTLFLSLTYKDNLDGDFFTNLLGKFGETGIKEVVVKIKKHIGKQGTLKIDSDIPIGCGMGSSAAVSAALSMLALELSGRNYNQFDVNHYAFELEKVAHNKPSGIDNTAAVYGGIRMFGMEIKERNFMDRLLIVDTGRPVETTSEMVAKVKKRFDKDPERMRHIMGSIGETTIKIRNSIVNGGSEEDFMELITANQRLLESLGVVGKSCREFVGLVESLGGAAKISGAGGSIAESGIVIVYLPDGVEIDFLLDAKDYKYLPLKVSGGIKIKVVEE